MLKVKAKIENHDTEMSDIVLRRFGRQDLVTATLLAYCSPLQFSFQGETLPRGWLDILIIGDTRCGKTTTVEGIMNALKMGEMAKGENTTFAGLIGGLQQMGSKSKWDIVWGKVPLNNGKLLIMDEMSSLSEDDIGNMSAVRSSGIAEINKIQSGITLARTRMIWLSNPRDKRKMNQFTYGVLAVRDLIGRPEDIARFDFAMAVRQDDVDPTIINARHVEREHSVDWTALRNLVQWAWSLRPSDIDFTPEAVDAVLDKANKMSVDFDSEIPLVEPNEQRIKIARVAAAVAVRCYSEVDRKLVIRPEHVEYADHFMRRVLSSRGMGYDRFSMGRKLEDASHDQAFEDISKLFLTLPNWKSAAVALYAQDFMSLTELEYILDVPRAECKTMVSVLMKNNCLRKKYGSSYEKSALMIKILEKLMDKG